MVGLDQYGSKHVEQQQSGRGGVKGVNKERAVTYSTLHVSDEYAHDRSEDEVLKKRRNESEGHTEHGEKQVGHTEVQQQNVGQRPHPTILRNRQRDQRVPGHRQHEDDHVQTDAQLHLYPSSTSTRRTVRPIFPRRIGYICHYYSMQTIFSTAATACCG